MAAILLVSGWGSWPLARSNSGSPRFMDFPSLCTCSESSLTNLIGSGLNLLCLHSNSKPECRWAWPGVPVFPAHDKRNPWGRGWAYTWIFTGIWLAPASRLQESIPALWSASRASKMKLSCLHKTTHYVLQEKFPRKPYNESFIGQVCLVKIAGYCPHFFCEFMDLDSLSVHNHAKKELGQYPAILTSHVVNNPYIQIMLFPWTPQETIT